MRFASLCFLALFAVLGCLPCDAQPPAPLTSVRTWGDLRAAPPPGIPVPAAGAAASPYRLGINVAAAKLYGGVVVYCLAESYTPDAKTGELGPFRVEVQHPDGVSIIRERQSSYAGPPRKQATGETLFMKSVPLTEPGDYIVSVQRSLNDEENVSWETVATTTVTVANDPGPLWSPWSLNAEDGAVGILASDSAYQRDSAVAGVANSSTGVAIPGMAKRFTGEVPDANLPLPELSPSEADPGVGLQAIGSLLIVTLDHGIVASFPDEKFLVRWWINGQPFTPKLAPVALPASYSDRHNGMQGGNRVTQITFQVEFRPEYLGAKKGDEIGVQLLLCPQGTEYSGPARDMQIFNSMVWAPADADVRSVEPRLSNRVTFPYSGDPIRMAPALTLPGKNDR